MQRWLNSINFSCVNKILPIILGILSLGLGVAYADEAQNSNGERAQLVVQQVDLIKARLTQAQFELRDLETPQNQTLASLSLDQVNKQQLEKIDLGITITKSNLDSANIELIDSQQTINWLEKNTQEIANQLEAIKIFGSKTASSPSPQVNTLSTELADQKQLLHLELVRRASLQELQDLESKILQLQKTRYTQTNLLLKSQRMMQIKQEQVKNELLLQQKQNAWLQKLALLRSELNQTAYTDKDKYFSLENAIFYANENANFFYLQILAARYQDQIRQMRLAVLRSNSLNLLNEVSNQFQSMSKQLTRLDELLKKRIDIIARHKNSLVSEKQKNNALIDTDIERFSTLERQYQSSVNSVGVLTQRLAAVRILLDKALQHELSARQGLPGFGVKMWMDIGRELLFIPSLTFQLFESLMVNVFKVWQSTTLGQWVLYGICQLGALLSLLFINKKLLQPFNFSNQYFTRVPVKYVFMHCLRRVFTESTLLISAMLFLWYFSVPVKPYIFLVQIALVGISFKAAAAFTRVYLVETLHDREGHDVRLYRRLRWMFLVGGLITAVTVFIHQLPFIYGVRELSDRLFLLFLLVVSLILFKSREVILHVILPHIDEARSYFRTATRLLGTLLPIILLVNSLIGLCGFVNLVFTISWYENIFLLVLMGYLILRGLLSDGMELLSQLFIEHVNNGWLWTEALLKPFDKILRITLFLSSWATLFLLYGWDPQSPIVERLMGLFHYRLMHILNTEITPLSIIEVSCVISVFYWMARWTREFVYRFLFSRTEDLGIKNSIAILSQYTVIVLGLFISLRVLGIDFRALAVVAGMFAFGVGLGLRDLANNFACGFLILIERPLRVGDLVSIKDCEGEVIHIGSRAVTVRSWDHMDVSIPNTEIFNKSFTNWTAKDNIIRTVIPIKVNRHDNPYEVKAIIHSVLASHPQLLKDPAPEVMFKEMNDALMEFEIRYFIDIREVKSRIGVRSSVLLVLWDAFVKNGIKPPYAQHEVHLHGDVPMLSHSDSLMKLT